MTATQTDIDILAHHITAYLAAHPDAADTVEGIQLWWLQNQGRMSLVTIEHALSSLVAAGLLTWRYNRDGVKIYRRAAKQ